MYTSFHSCWFSDYCTILSQGKGYRNITVWLVRLFDKNTFDNQNQNNKYNSLKH